MFTPPGIQLLFLAAALILTGCGAEETRASTGGLTAQPSSSSFNSTAPVSNAVPGTELADGNTRTADRLHPRFQLTKDELTRLLEETASREPGAITDDIEEAILSHPQVFLELAARILDEYPADLVLVDKNHALPADYIPPDLVAMTEYPQLYLNRNDLRLRKRIIPDLLAMVEAADQAGARLVLSSTYRSFEYQDGLFQRHVREMGEAEASRVSARPGTSQHQLGTVVDFGSITPEYARHPGGIWLAAEAWRYGFSLSYPEGYEALTGYDYEPWHFRWIGRPAARLEHEFFQGIQQRFLLAWQHLAGSLSAALR